MKEYQQIDICCREIKKLQDSLDVKKVIYSIVPGKERLQQLLEKMKHITDDEILLNELKKFKIVYEADTNEGFIQMESASEDSFLRKLEREIKKREELIALHQSTRSGDVIVEKEKHTDLTLERAVLAMNYLLRFAKVNCHNTDKAKFISFLTGYSENTIAQKFSTLHKKEDANFTAYEKDMKVIRKYFEKLGLNEIVKMIDNDLEV